MEETFLACSERTVNRIRLWLLAIKALRKEFLKSDMEMNMPPRWGFSSFWIGVYNYVASPELTAEVRPPLRQSRFNSTAMGPG